VSQRIPSWGELLTAIATVEEWLLAKIAEIRLKFPGHDDVLGRLEDILKAKQRTLEALLAIGTELQALSGGQGPVDHDPVDWAALLDEYEGPPNA
jgi:hypothetical protein